MVKELPTSVQEMFERLKAANPIFSGDLHLPEGAIDLCGLKFPCDLHAGPYVKIDEQGASLNVFKFLVGSPELIDSAFVTLVNLGFTPTISERKENEIYVAIVWSV